MPKKLIRHEDEDFEASENDDFDQQVGDYEEDEGSIEGEDNELIDQGDEEKTMSDEEVEGDEVSAGDNLMDDENDQEVEETSRHKKGLEAESETEERATPARVSANIQPPKSFWKYNESSSDDDDAPEEVGNTSKKQETLELYQRQKEAAMATKRRKRKQRTAKVEETLDEETLNLLSMNSEVLSAVTTPADEKPRSKVIHLSTEDLNPTQKVEKKVDGFKLVSLPKNSNASLGKPINSDILEFQRRHFYGKNTNRVDAGAYLSKLAARRRR